MGFVALGKFHGDAQVNQAEFALLQSHGFRSTQVNPIGLAAHVRQARDRVVEISDDDCSGFHEGPSKIFAKYNKNLIRDEKFFR